MYDPRISVRSVTVAADGSGTDQFDVSTTGGDALIQNTNIDVSTAEDGAAGGRVEITGDRVALLGATAIDASGRAGGGEVPIGGDYQGGGSLRTADATTVAATAAIRADALGTGDGGRVIVWSDDVTRYYGSNSATGGAAGGDGGFVGTSGEVFLEPFGSVDAATINGTLNTDTGVTITTGASGVQAGDITVNSAIS